MNATRRLNHINLRAKIIGTETLRYTLILTLIFFCLPIALIRAAMDWIADKLDGFVKVSTDVSNWIHRRANWWDR